MGLALTFAASGCKRPTYMTPLPGPRTGGAPGENNNPRPMPPIDPTNVGPIAIPGSDDPRFNPIAASTIKYSNWKHDATALEAQTVHFDYDSAVVKAGESSKIQIVAAYLQSNPTHAVLIEGHCDERGTEEYNRSLGERRALAVREGLVAAGISPERVDTVSFGEDRPADPAHNKAAWTKNRRGAFVLLTPP